MLAALGPAALSAAGGIVSNFMTDNRADKAAQFNAEQAAINRQWQEKMSNTAYRRSMVDMRAAGLNPILAYSKGGASSPSGSTASTSFVPANDVITPAVSTAMQATRLKEEVANMQETNRNLRSTNNLINAQAAQAGASTAKTVAETAITTEMLKEAQRKGQLGEIDKKFYESTIGQVLRNLGLGLGELNPLTRTVPRPHIVVPRPD